MFTHFTVFFVRLLACVHVNDEFGFRLWYAGGNPCFEYVIATFLESYRVFFSQFKMVYDILPHVGIDLGQAFLFSIFCFLFFVFYLQKLVSKYKTTIFVSVILHGFHLKD